MKNDKEIEIKYDPQYPWVSRINQVRKNSKLTQNEFAQKSDLSSGTLSQWTFRKTEPKVQSLKKVSDAFGVSMDYLMGKHECKTPENQKISDVTGLTDDAINRIRWARKRIFEKGDSSAEKKLAACNYLLETMKSSTLLESLYDYLLGQYSFRSRNGEDLDALISIVAKMPSGEEKQSFIFSSAISQAYFANVQHELMKLKEKIIAENDAKNKIEGKKREQENKEEIERNYWDMMAKTETGVDSE